MNWIDFCLALLFILLPFVLGYYQSHRMTDKGKQLEIILLYYLFIAVGIQGFSCAFWQILYPDLVSEFLGWPNTPFLMELGLANLTFGVLGILSPWMDRGWRATTGIGYGLFLFFTGIAHLIRIAQYGISKGDFGWFLATDLLLAFILLALSIQYKKAAL